MIDKNTYFSPIFFDSISTNDSELKNIFSRLLLTIVNLKLDYQSLDY